MFTWLRELNIKRFTAYYISIRDVSLTMQTLILSYDTCLKQVTVYDSSDFIYKNKRKLNRNLAFWLAVETNNKYISEFAREIYM